MEIIVSNMNKNTEILKKFMKNYLDNYLNLYNALLETSTYWQDDKSNIFFDEVIREKNDIKNNIDELNGLIEIYEYIIKEYSKLGNNIKIKLEQRERIIDRLNNYINKIDGIINLYNNLNLSYYNNNLITNQRNRLYNKKEYIKSLKYKIEILFAEVDRIEQEIIIRLSKVDIKILKEKEINQFI